MFRRLCGGQKLVFLRFLLRLIFLYGLSIFLRGQKGGSPQIWQFFFASVFCWYTKMILQIPPLLIQPRMLQLKWCFNFFQTQNLLVPIFNWTQKILGIQFLLTKKFQDPKFFICPKFLHTHNFFLTQKISWTL